MDLITLALIAWAGILGFTANWLINPKISLAETGKRILNMRYLKMYLVRDGLVIGTYIRDIKETGWILDKSLKMCWKIPSEGEMIKTGKCSWFTGSLESIRTLEWKDIKKPELKGKWWDTITEGGIPFLRKPFHSKKWSNDKLKFITGEKKEIQYIDKMGTTYTPVLPMLDMGSLYLWLTGSTLKLIMESAIKEKKNMDLLIYAALAIGAILFIYFFVKKG